MNVSSERLVKAFGAVVGADHVAVDDASRLRAERTTFATSQRVVAIVQPRDRAEVQECMRVANALRVPVYPVSTGKNWGYGGRVPPADASVLLDLGRMNRIVDYDEDLAYVTVEPGVTQRQLLAFLRERGGKLWMDPTAASIDASVLGNVLERGHGLTPYADHVEHAAGLEVVLPSGECLRTGHGRFGGSERLRIAALDRWGVGPALDGLFTQSSLGIVTEMTVWLLPRPEHVEAIFFGLDGDAQVARAFDVLRPLRLDGTLRIGPRFANVYRNLRYGLYPWERTRGETPLSVADAVAYGRELGIAPWNGTIGLYGRREEVGLVRARILPLLEGASDVRVVDEDALAAADASPDVKRKRGIFRMLSGEIENEGVGVRLCYWRKKALPAGALDPERDGCGVVWLAPVVPFRGDDVARLMAIASEVSLRHGFEPDMALLSFRPRVLHGHMALMYDRDEPGADARAMACHDELELAFERAGYWPHRLGLQSMRVMDEGDAVHRGLLRAFEELLDRNEVLAPGRYTPSRRS